MQKHFVPNINVANANILPSFKNFSGTKFGDGKRGFAWRIDDPAIAKSMNDDGWRVKVTVRDPGMVKPLIDDGWKSVSVYPELTDDIQYRLEIAVNLNPPAGVAPAEIYTHKGNITNKITPENAAELDFVQFVNVDMTINPRWWASNDGDWAIKAYLRVMHITLEEDPWADKYPVYQVGNE